MKIWIDEVRKAPNTDTWTSVFSVNSAKQIIQFAESHNQAIEIIDIGCNAGKFAHRGGDYIELLKWFEETGRRYRIRLHGTDLIGVAKMRRIIRRNNWTEVK